MKKDHKKTIIIATIIAVILIILIVGGILFFTTDLFKTKQELFFKYFAQNMEVVEEYLQDPNKLAMDSIKSEPYIVTSNVNFDLVSTDANIANQTTPPRNFSIEYTKNVDPQNNRDYSEAKVRYLTKELFTAQYAHDGDLHVVNGINGANQAKIFNIYLGIENKNLKQLAQKLGIQDVSNIPNQLGNISITDLISLNKEEKQYFQDFLVKVITSQIPKEKYYHTKGVEVEINTKPVKANVYGVTLTSEEYQNLTIAMLNAMAQDDTILNIILQKIMKIDLQTDITQDQLKEQIVQIIEKLNENSFQNGITVEVYETEGKIVRTQIKFSDNDVYTIDFERASNSIRTLISLNNTFTIEEQNQEIQDNPPIIQDGYHVIEGSANIPTPTETPEPRTITIKNIEIAKQISGSQTNMIAILTYEIDNSVMKVSLQTKTEPNNTQGFTNNMIMIINDSATTYFTIKANSNYATSNSISVQELNETNSAVLNNRTRENISQLLNALKAQLQKIYEQQMQVANEVQQQEGNTGLNQVDPNAAESNTITDIPNVVE